MHCGPTFSNCLAIIASSEKCVQFTVICCLCMGLVDGLHWKFIDMENIGYVPHGHCRLSLSYTSRSAYTHMALKFFLWVSLAKPLNFVLLALCDRLRSPVPFDDVEAYIVSRWYTLTHVQRTYNLFYSIFVFVCVLRIWTMKRDALICGIPHFLFFFLECKWNDE